MLPISLFIFDQKKPKNQNKKTTHILKKRKNSYPCKNRNMEFQIKVLTRHEKIMAEFSKRFSNLLNGGCKIRMSLWGRVKNSVKTVEINSFRIGCTTWSDEQVMYLFSKKGQEKKPPSNLEENYEFCEWRGEAPSGLWFGAGRNRIFWKIPKNSLLFSLCSNYFDNLYWTVNSFFRLVIFQTVPFFLRFLIK